MGGFSLTARRSHHRHRTSFVFFVYPVLLVLIACNNQPAPAQLPAVETRPNKDSTTYSGINGNFSDQSKLKLDSASIPIFFSKFKDLRPYQKNVEAFYKGRKFAYAWYDANGMIEPASNLYARLNHLENDGISTPAPYQHYLDTLMESTDNAPKEQKEETELMLSANYFYFASKVWGGLDATATTKLEWYLPRKKVSYAAWLDSALARGGSDPSVINAPVFRQYGLLKKFLAKYKQIEKGGRWKIIKADKKSYRLNDSSHVIVEIKEKLRLLEDFKGADSTPVFNEGLETAVRNFQYRSGLKEDGIVGPSMLEDLNNPMKTRIEKILVNMERSRWLPVSASGDYMAVNIPEFKLHVYRDDSLLWSMNVVVGKSVTKTVVFSGNMQYVVFSPYWNVPSSIYKKEVLPGMRRNSNYLARHHMEKWGNGVRQLPGPWNSLGKVKFLFPNSYSIYFHDTPSKSLFNETSRDFSHGCIRLAEPKKMAMYVLRDDLNWDEQKITAAMDASKEKTVTLKKAVPVFITYLTAWVDRSGQLNLRPDIYKRDGRLASMIETDFRP